MIYIRIKFVSCVFLLALLSIAYSKPTPDLRKKLERLLRDSEYDELKNEIVRPRQMQGMLLKEHKLYDSLSEERFYDLLNRLEKNPAGASNLSEEIKPSFATTTTTTTTTTESSSTTAISTQATLGSVTSSTTSKQKSPSVIGGIERLSSIVSRFIHLWRKP